MTSYAVSVLKWLGIGALIAAGIVLLLAALLILRVAITGGN
jgi:hypothetical protein